MITICLKEYVRNYTNGKILILLRLSYPVIFLKTTDVITSIKIKSRTDTIDDIKDSFSMIGTNLGSAVIPIIQQFADLIIANMPMIQEIIPM